MPIQSAGILLYRKFGFSTQVFLIHPGGPFWKNKETWCDRPNSQNPEIRRQSDPSNGRLYVFPDRPHLLFDHAPTAEAPDGAELGQTTA